MLDDPRREATVQASEQPDWEGRPGGHRARAGLVHLKVAAAMFQRREVERKVCWAFESIQS